MEESGAGRDGEVVKRRVGQGGVQRWYGGEWGREGGEVAQWKDWQGCEEARGERWPVSPPPPPPLAWSILIRPKLG